MLFRTLIFLIFCTFFFIIAGSQPARKVKSAHITAKKSNDVIRNGDTLTVFLRKGKVKKYIDKRQEGELFSFKEKLAQTQYLLFQYQYRFGEVTGFLIVNKRNGSQCSVPGKPLLSPNGKRFVTSCVDLEAQYNPNSIAIYRLDKDSCRVEYFMEPTEWGATKVKWLTNFSLEYKKAVMTETGMKTVETSILQLRRNRWLLK
jgi:hypothetical protein